jgi:hypothetical protein
MPRLNNTAKRDRESMTQAASGFQQNHIFVEENIHREGAEGE